MAADNARTASYRLSLPETRVGGQALGIDITLSLAAT